MQSSLPFSAAADRNKEAIGDAIEALLNRSTTVLEIGSGSGQHAVYLCRRFGHLQWQVTEQSQYLEGLQAVVSDASLDNILNPFELEVSAVADDGLTVKGMESNYSLVYSANTSHIMRFDQVPAYLQLPVITYMMMVVLHSMGRLKKTDNITAMAIATLMQVCGHRIPGWASEILKRLRSLRQLAD